MRPCGARGKSNGAAMPDPADDRLEDWERVAAAGE